MSGGMETKLAYNDGDKERREGGSRGRNAMLFISFGRELILLLHLCVSRAVYGRSPCSLTPCMKRADQEAIVSPEPPPCDRSRLAADGVKKVLSWSHLMGTPAVRTDNGWRARHFDVPLQLW